LNLFLAILFNVDQLGAAYGLAAYKLLFGAIDPIHFHGCYFSDGDVGEQYCIAIECSEAPNLFKIEAAIGASNAEGLAAPNSRLAFDARVLNYLAPAGYISHQGILEQIENTWMKTAWVNRQSAQAPGNLIGELDSPLPETMIANSPPVSTSSPGDEYRLGDLIGGDYVVRAVHKGGMGIVYIVEDLESRRKTLQLRLALKTFQSRYLWNDEAIGRFEREALVWIGLGKHPNIVHAMLVQRVANRPYLWLEYVDGESLADLLDRKRLTTAQATGFALQFCRGMRHAHEQHGIIHRDIKPANTLITHENVLKITDFGLSKLQAEFVGEAYAREGATMNADETETVTGSFVTAAGQCMGTPAYIAPEAVTAAQTVDVRSDIYSFGIMLYEMLAGERPFRAGNIFLDHQNAVPGPVSLLNPNVSPELNRIVARCLEKAPGRRFQNFAELEEVLLRASENASRFDPATEQVSIPEFGSWFMKAFTFMEVGKFDGAIECFQQVIALDPAQHEAYNNMGVCLGRLNRIDDAVAAIEKATMLKGDYAEAWSNLGGLYELQQRYEDGIRACHRAIELKPRWAEAHSNLGSNLSRIGRLAEAKSSFYRAIVEDDSYWLAYLKLAELLTNERSPAEALKLLQKAHKINPRDADVLAALAACLADFDQEQEAAKYVELALKEVSEHPLARRVEKALSEIRSNSPGYESEM